MCVTLNFGFLKVYILFHIVTLTHFFIVCIFMLEFLESEDEKRYLKVGLLLRKMCIYGFFC